MKRRLSIVGNNRDRENSSPQQRVTLNQQILQHIEILFKSQHDLCEVLDTTPKTWRDIKNGEGVREATARRIVIEFVSVLRKVVEGKLIVTDKLHAELVPALDEIYSLYLISLNFDDLLERKNT